MKVYVVVEKTEETGAKDFDCTIFCTYQKAKEFLFEREKELYKSYGVEQQLARCYSAEYYPFVEDGSHSVHYFEQNDGYYLQIREMEVK